ncbi:MAG: alpha/beta fold hydrolase [Moraxellaceae bacterium]
MSDVQIAAPAGHLQVRPIWQDSDMLVVICHPHPLFGGTMDNKVVTTLARFWRRQGYSVLMFNFRGVGNSTGRHDDGIGEIDDLRTVLTWAQSQCAATRLILAGFSFGAYIAAAGVDRFTTWQVAQLQLQQLVLVAPAVENYPMAALQLPAKTRVIIGDQDEVVSPAAMQAWAQTYPLDLVVVPDAGHFFHGRLNDLSAHLAW